MNRANHKKKRKTTTGDFLEKFRAIAEEKDWPPAHAATGTDAEMDKKSIDFAIEQYHSFNLFIKTITCTHCDTTKGRWQFELKLQCLNCNCDGAGLTRIVSYEADQRRAVVCFADCECYQ